jgi:SAM-dependent methyltransferase
VPLSDIAVASEACPVCAAHGDRPIYPDVLDPVTLDHFRVGECPHCGVAYTLPRPSSLDRYYPPVYRDYGPFVTRILGILYNARVSRWARLKAEGGSVLEVGCGPGLMLAAFRRRGWRVLGIERNEKVTESARKSLGLEIVAVPVEALSKDARFDLIIMFQVLEHIADPVALLRECAKRLAPGGRLIINVPNFSSWQARFARAKWLHLDAPRHLVHYTPQTLSATLERAGLHLVNLSFASPEHDPYGWVESSISHLTGRQNTLTRFLMGLDRFDMTVLLSFVLGVLLLVPALMLAGVSWIAKRGALMEAIAVNSAPR